MSENVNKTNIYVFSDAFKIIQTNSTNYFVDNGKNYLFPYVPLIFNTVKTNTNNFNSLSSESIKSLSFSSLKRSSSEGNIDEPANKKTKIDFHICNMKNNYQQEIFICLRKFCDIIKSYELENSTEIQKNGLIIDICFELINDYEFENIPKIQLMLHLLFSN